MIYNLLICFSYRVCVFPVGMVLVPLGWCVSCRIGAFAVGLVLAIDLHEYQRTGTTALVLKETECSLGIFESM